jgi:hypothetical protein
VVLPIQVLQRRALLVAEARAKMLVSEMRSTGWEKPHMHPSLQHLQRRRRATRGLTLVPLDAHADLYDTTCSRATA